MLRCQAAPKTYDRDPYGASLGCEVDAEDAADEVDVKEPAV